MDRPKGFFSLQTSLDLLNKMERDCRRISAAPLDVDPAFDFFVAANHLPEWLGRAKCSPGKMDAYGRALCDICAQLANGAKHFETEGHTAIDGTAVIPPAIFGQAVFGVSRFGDATGALEIYPGDDEAEALGEAVFSAVDLAAKVLAYWHEHESVQRARRLFYRG